ncbi:ATP--cob(I)alamin adenosyltransferase [Virgibacillus pantothenticus]|uniref:cob(I)yrinic acid a,c-diamide adenosyltransferase n=1 Tax=Virgibacillus TaxID=84406 RepID=UPI00090C2476|nr:MULTISPECIES: cob(I)yrinic acid a,c-diamide adenosyltransferase [Virgibacillus]API91269.1 ATP:cob(I)alamin adenosyltransferase [Virgibacillus sp. 6R]MBS7426500.1 cob(I)yrinic acid a,c-diamide adenosyltransferase [Virgibacillus sp. 19R1-5]MBU8567314.1 cob(I)yrinic acid a,c-diamide adenosyltransferase [Virgibacillus pantothenticus]MBU8600070.1 cob(I)yrinic acid a,c-diamide adenosyltransferase [Virgibacillus pantothenticus]MBU8635349.1 cob(I)yrinic acid a,c-diamide adenosyltransferase [Virgiba
MRIYTRSGDKGKTSLIYGERVNKNDLRVEAYGTCDEVNSMIGLAISFLEEKSFPKKTTVIQELISVQTLLFYVGSELSTPADKEVPWQLKEEHIQTLEKQIDHWDEQLEQLTNFILPSGVQAASAVHVARTVTRRAERLAVAIEGVNPLAIAFLNRLSDYLFVAARYINQSLKGEERSLHMT